MGERAFALDPIIEAPGSIQPVWGQQLVRCVVEHGVNQPAVAMLAFRDPDHELLTATGIKIGTQLRVSMVSVADRSRVPLFVGEVTALELEVDQTGTFTVLRGLDRAHRLFRGRKVVAFRNMTAADIVRRVASGAGLTVAKADAKGPTYQQLTQANVTDWEFLRQLADDHGATLDLDIEGRLSFTTPTPASSAPSPRTRARQNPQVLEYGDNLISLRAALTSAAQVATVEVRGWDATTKRAVIGRSPATTSDTVEAGITAGQATSAFGGSPRLLVAESPYRTQSEVDNVAKAQAAANAATFAEWEAVCEGDAELRVGKPVALGNVGPTFSGRYTPTAIRHVVEPAIGYRTTAILCGERDRTVAGFGAGGDPVASAPRMPGLAVGVVTDVKEPGNRGRGWVRLKFPWLSDDYITDWVRTVQFGGVRGGGVLCPEVNDEVLVGFEQGSLDRPYVLGGLYNGVDLPSPHDVPLIDATSGKVNRHSLVSRSGQRLELLDASNGSTGVRLRTSDQKLEVYLDQQQTSITVHSDGTVRIEASKQVTVTGQGISLDAGQGDLTLTGRSVSMTGTTGVTVDGGTEAVLRGTIVRIN
jgi:uncharacterized protein involved in type VI secretion and phage assembly